jgi:Ca2+-binding EF-hand superfamily protein
MGQPTAEMARTAHAETDLNGDGAVDREEFHRRMVEIFYLNDIDKDGHLNAEELARMNEGMVFEPADTNDDGKLTLPEYIDQRFKAFHDVDDDSDGLISVEEVVDAYTNP